MSLVVTNRQGNLDYDPKNSFIKSIRAKGAPRFRYGFKLKHLYI